MRKHVLDALRKDGLRPSGHAVTLETTDLLWIVEPDPSPRGHRLSVDVGCHIKSLAVDDAGVDRANLCHINVALENLPLTAIGPPSLQRFSTYQSLAVATLDQRTDLDDADRASALSTLLAPLAELIRATRTASDLRARYLEGAFGSAFIHRDARVLLERTA